MSLRKGATRDNPLVLLVEDDDRLADLRALLLEERGVAVSVSNSVNSARAFLESGLRPDAVILDVKLGPEPGEKGGIELAREIRRKFPETPIVAYSAFYSEDDLAEADSLFDRSFAKGNTSVSGIEDALNLISDLARQSHRRRS